MPITLSDFGSYTVGGRLLQVTTGEPERIAVTRSVEFLRDPKGHYAIEHAYVQYFVPADRNARPPVLLVHGGGLSGAVWERTPDGRPGWLQMLLARGFEVHVLDNVERGRAGFAPGQWEGEPILRSLEEAWTLFRIGTAEGFATRTAFPGQRFPTACLEPFARIFVPRWLGTSGLQADALRHAMIRLGGALVICHSQGAETTLTAIESGAPVAGLMLVEPSAAPGRCEALSGVPTVLVTGDHLDTDALWRRQKSLWEMMVRDLAAAGVPLCRLHSGTELAGGHSHMPMLDLGSDAVLEAAMDALLGLLDRA